MIFETKDSGERQVFETGMHRDAGEKPLHTEVYGPLDEQLFEKSYLISLWQTELSFNVIHFARHKEDSNYLIKIIRLVHLIEAAKNDEDLIHGRCLSLDLRYGQLMQRGAVKYDRGNWRKAGTRAELERFKDSLDRHGSQYLRGEVDEDHAAAILFNCYGAAMVLDKLKEVLK